MKKISAKNIIGMLCGTFLTGTAVSVFLLPNKIVSGGVSGASTLLYHTFGFEPGISLVIMNIILLALGFKVLGKEFIINTIIGAGLLSGFVQLMSYVPPITENAYLAALFGAILYGGGQAITFISGASTGGTDIVGRTVQHFFPHFSIGNLLLVIDGVIIALSYVVFKDADLLLLSIISLAVSTFSIDFVIRYLNATELVFVVTDKGEIIAKKLVETSPRGVTRIEVWGEYTNEKKSLLLCALKNKELTEFKRKVKEIDENAFIILSEAQHIDGNGFLLYR